MAEILLSEEYAKEIQAEATATRRCLERIPINLFQWKPHEKSMTLGYLALLVAEIPKWIDHIVTIGEIDFATFQHYQPGSTEDLVRYYDENLAGAFRALKGVSNDKLENENFSLKANGHLLFTASKKDNVSSTINHWVHHRGQLTVYMRLNDIAVPSIYGPSADDKTFAIP